MTVLSILRGIRPAAGILTAPTKSSLAREFTTSVIRNGGHGHHRFEIMPSKWGWTKYKDMFHFYFMLGIIPACGVAFLANVFVGPATLCEIPPGYVPKHWEYNKHPISRFLLKYCRPSHQETYERNLHYLFLEEEKRQMRLMGWKVEALMKSRGDYPNYYVSRSILSKYVRDLQEEVREQKDMHGSDTEHETPLGDGV